MAEYVEFENENRLRAYPFAESSSFVADDGYRIENTFVLDAMIYAYRPDGPVRLTEIDFDNRTVTISDNSNVVGTAELGSNKKIDFSCVVYKKGNIEYTKPAGSIYVSDEFLGGTGKHTFSSLYFSASCVCPVNPHGVEGIIIEGQLLTGLVHFTTHTDTVWSYFYTGTTGGRYLGFKVKPKRTEQQPIRVVRRIIVKVEPSSPFVIGRYGKGVQLSLGNISREDICSSTTQRRAQDYYESIHDTCAPLASATGTRAFTRSASDPIIVDMKSCNGAFNMLTPDLLSNDASIDNPISISPNVATRAAAPLNLTPDMSQPQREQALLNSLNSGESGNSVSISIPGLL